MSKRVIRTVGTVALVLCSAGMARLDAKPVLKVLCGAGIRPPMEEIAKRFRASHGCEVSMNYAGSGTLFGSLQAGTAADVYLPGDIWYIKAAREKGMVASHKTAAWFVPVIAVQKGNPKGVKSLADLAAKGLKVGVGRAEACAIGNVTKSLLEAEGLAGKIRPSFEALTVNRLANQLKLKTLDATIVWDATAKWYPDCIDIVELKDGNLHAVALAAGVLTKSANPELAAEFVDYTASEEAAKIFKDNLYQVAGRSIRIGCGSSMRPPIEELAALFRAETGVDAFTNYGSSGTVLLQIQESKQGDVYICHDPFAYTCEDRKLSEAWHTIAVIEPTLGVLAGNPKGVKGLADLLRPDLKVGLPHSKYSTRGKILWAMLEKAGLADDMEKRKYFESRTHDLVNQLKLKTVDIAVLWDAPVKAMSEFDVVPVEEKYKIDAVTSATTGRSYSMRHVKVTLVRLNLSKEPLLAAQFAKTCLSDAGRKILEKHCFTVLPK